ncbi:hypothetical protein CVT25_015353 [Psilocybe cyanescens]|uniref:Uncharacterized protein n=1 Tax=Psilocybe cyanescens TaxID=93625 RepID=A0A409WHA2_PSICY|nr:hypothetical protein CVT25_015353 [Psilocybe cyanescens]
MKPNGTNLFSSRWHAGTFWEGDIQRAKAEPFGARGRRRLGVGKEDVRWWTFVDQTQGSPSGADDFLKRPLVDVVAETES